MHNRRCNSPNRHRAGGPSGPPASPSAIGNKTRHSRLQATPKDVPRHRRTHAGGKGERLIPKRTANNHAHSKEHEELPETHLARRTRRKNGDSY